MVTIYQQKQLPMYETLITTSDVALCHLFIHCCFKDGEFKRAEIDVAADKFVSLELHKELNFKNEMRNYLYAFIFWLPRRLEPGILILGFQILNQEPRYSLFSIM